MLSECLVSLCGLSNLVQRDSVLAPYLVLCDPTNSVLCFCVAYWSLSGSVRPVRLCCWVLRVYLAVCSSCVCARLPTPSVCRPGTLRCPICRAPIPLPTGGVAALPPSFVVNQLLDLMSRQRREVVPKCSTHQTEVSTSGFTQSV